MGMGAVSPALLYCTHSSKAEPGTSGAFRSIAALRTDYFHTAKTEGKKKKRPPERTPYLVHISAC